MAIVRTIVAQEADLGTGAIAASDVHITVVVPVHVGDSASVVRETESADGRDVGKSPTTHVQKGAISLVAAPGMTLTYTAIDYVPSLAVVFCRARANGLGG